MYICNTYRTRLTSMNTRDIHTKPDGLNTHSHEDHLKNSKACTKALKHNLNANTRSSEQIHTKRTQTNVLQMDGQTCHGISHGIEVCMSLSCAILIGQDWMCGCSNYRANVFHESAQRHVTHRFKMSLSSSFAFNVKAGDYNQTETISPPSISPVYGLSTRLCSLTCL